MFDGKTIESVDMSACNEWVFYFTDGTSVAIYTDRLTDEFLPPVLVARDITNEEVTTCET